VPRTPPSPHLRSAALARLTGVSVDTLRHYEVKGLLAAPPRTASGYREYPPEAVARVRLVRRAVGLGFTLDELARVLAVRDRGGAPCRGVRALAQSKLAAIESRLEALTAARELMQLVLARWDALLAAAPPDGRAGLLDALEDVVDEGAASPLLPLGRKRRPAGPGVRR
jgi:DNA-binding transcriptional MerR regulator